MLQTLLFLLLTAGPLQQGPWVYGARENSVNILWVSEKPGMAYVELADGTVHFETYAGRRIFKRLHRVRLNGLEAGAVVRYRTCGVNLASDANPYDPVFADAYEGEWHSVRTLDRKAPDCHFSVFNDIHMRTQDYAALAAQVDSAGTDFIFLNGDIVSAGNYQLDTLVHYALEPLGNLPSGIPILFGRGNHEGRGNNVQLISEIYPNDDPAPFYYTFRQGPVAFIVFDGGETWTERSALYTGKDYYEDYMYAQLEWAKRAVREASFRKAPIKICLVHVPMIDHQDKTDFLLQRWMNRHFMELLNKSHVNLMIGADLHEFMYCEKGTMGNDFPIIVNDDVRRMDVTCKNGVISIRTYNADGEKEFEKNLTL